jgi:hypothetical protein
VYNNLQITSVTEYVVIEQTLNGLAPPLRADSALFTCSGEA